MYQRVYQEPVKSGSTSGSTWGSMLGGLAGAGLGVLLAPAGPAGVAAGIGIGGQLGSGLGGVIGSEFDTQPTFPMQQQTQQSQAPINLSAFQAPDVAFDQGGYSREAYRSYLQDLFKRNEIDEIGYV